MEDDQWEHKNNPTKRRYKYLIKHYISDIVQGEFSSTIQWNINTSIQIRRSLI